jgi:formylglycine-generating enzyme required for sulfatase activity
MVMKHLFGVLTMVVSGLSAFEGSARSPVIEMIYVKGGAFAMGCPGERGNNCYADEKPVHRVTVSDFYIGKYEVTQSEWDAVMEGNPSYFTLAPAEWEEVKMFMTSVNQLNRTAYRVPTETEWNRASVIECLPVEQVSWDDVQEFIRRLNAETGMNYRLPTEAEWEYAARGGSAGAGYKYSGSDEAGEVAWYGDNSGGKTHLVGTKKPNELGICDMSGNVGEWTGDCFSRYADSAQTDPVCRDVPGADFVFRGGGWHCGSRLVRVPIRQHVSSGVRESNLGFRLACSP